MMMMMMMMMMMLIIIYRAPKFKSLKALYNIILKQQLPISD